MFSFESGGLELKETDEKYIFIMLNYMGHVVSWFFLMDICYKFNLAYLDGDGNLIKNRTKIRKRYMVLTKFWFDLLIGFPWYIFINEDD